MPMMSAGGVAGKRLWTTCGDVGVGSAAMALEQQPGGAHDPLRGWVDDDLADRLAGEERVDVDLTAADLVEAEWARAGWRYRLLRDVGRSVTLWLASASASGELVELFEDALLLRSSEAPAGRAPAGDLLVAWHAVHSVSRDGGARAADRVPTSRQVSRRTARALLRQWAGAGCEVTVTAVDSHITRGRLSTITADTLDVLDEASATTPDALSGAPRSSTLPWHAVAAVRRRSG
jgi:hypothetical protein